MKIYVDFLLTYLVCTEVAICCMCMIMSGEKNFFCFLLVVANASHL